ncbi:portal protein [Thermus phage TMA]|uniref:portal protein n=1 Tax=Thermus phage TMA TaxID=699370 RepID=UPI00021AAE1C|nr:portal protein [Thermus phage TMA]BAK53691.1 portal protein [Thermus phage TMA]
MKSLENIIKGFIVNANEQKRPSFSSNIKANVDSLSRGKDYPGFKPLLTYRALAWNSTVVYSIIIFRKNQVLKKEKIIVPYNHQEPPFKFNLFEYSPESLMYLPSISDPDAFFLINLFRKYRFNNDSKLIKVSEIPKKLTSKELEIYKHIEDKHVNYYLKRIRDSRKILEFLERPDPYFSEVNSWEYLLGMVLDDILTIDRGAIVKIRDEQGNLVAITPVDGTTIKPILSEDTGIVVGYVQEVDGAIVAHFDKRDVVLFRQNLTPDVYMYGYSLPPIEILYKVILSDIFIDKGNLDYYRKGGSIPEGILAIEPPSYKEGDIYPQLSREQLESIQRQLQAIMMGDYTQVPILSGGKFTWIDFKGKRRDMQFKELAEFVARKICAVYQVSPQDVGILEGSNKATAEVMASLTKAKGLEPLMATISKGFDEVVSEFRNEKDIKLWFKEDDLEKERDWWNIIQGQLNTGFRSINEARMEKGLEPVPWGDVPFSGLRNWKPEDEQAKAQQGAMPPQLAQAMADQPSQQGGGADENSSVPSEQKNAGLEVLRNLFKSLDANASENLKQVIELTNDDNYLKEKELLTRVLKSVGLDSVSEFIENNSQTDVEVSAKDILSFKYNSLVEDETIYATEKDIVLRLLGKNSLDHRETFGLIATHFDCHTVPKVEFYSDKDKRYVFANLSVCSPINSVEKFTRLDELLSCTTKKPTKLEIVFDWLEFKNFKDIDLLKYSQLGDSIKKKNYDSFDYLDDVEKLLVAPYEELENLVNLLKKKFFVEGELFSLVDSYKATPHSLFLLFSLIEELGVEKINSLVASCKGVLEMLLGMQVENFETNHAVHWLLSFSYDKIREVIASLSYFIETISIDCEFEKIRLLGTIGSLISSFGQNKNINFVFVAENFDDYMNLVESISEEVDNIFMKSFVFKSLLGEQLERQEARDYVKEFIKKKYGEL